MPWNSPCHLDFTRRKNCGDKMHGYHSQIGSPSMHACKTKKGMVFLVEMDADAQTGNNRMKTRNGSNAK